MEVPGRGTALVGGSGSGVPPWLDYLREFLLAGLHEKKARSQKSLNIGVFSRKLDHMAHNKGRASIPRVDTIPGMEAIEEKTCL